MYVIIQIKKLIYTFRLIFHKLHLDYRKFNCFDINICVHLIFPFLNWEKLTCKIKFILYQDI